MTPVSAARICRLSLRNFRSYAALQLDIGTQPIVLVGANGAGKTNLLEALSLLAPGRGFRRPALDALAHAGGDGSWAVAAEVDGALGLATLGTGIDPTGSAAGAPETRRCRIDREPVGSAAAFAAHLQVIWLVPAMDALFTGPAAERRRFVDRVALATDHGHGTRVNALERSLRARNRLLEEARPDARWLDAVEHETAELAVAVAAGRAETVRRLAQVLAARADDAAFPAAAIHLTGWMEDELRESPALAIEDRYRAILREARARDAAAGRTREGPHLSDLAVSHRHKGIAATDASTGEQKALLIGLILAHAGLIAQASGHAPVLLLDEVVAHLDPQRRRALYDRLERLGPQVWMSGADPAAFADLAGRAQMFEVSPGEVTARG